MQGEAGQVHQNWDGAGNTTCFGYDLMCRPSSIEQASANAVLHCVERLYYGASEPDVIARNQCGRLIRHADTAGVRGGGLPLRWTARNQLEEVILVQRPGAENDSERYVYDSAGMRVRKLRTSLAGGVSRKAQVRYLPGLEIRTEGADSNEEVLHVITTEAGLSSVRLLHWEEGRPSGIVKDQLRYSFDDLLGSSTQELDEDADLNRNVWSTRQPRLFQQRQVVANLVALTIQPLLPVFLRGVRGDFITDKHRSVHDPVGNGDQVLPRSGTARL